MSLHLCGDELGADPKTCVSQGEKHPVSVTFRYTFVTYRTALLNDVTIENSSEMEAGPGPRLDQSKAIVVTWS